MIKVTSEELDNLELRLRLLANAAEAGSAPKRLSRRAADALRALSFSMNKDRSCARVPGPDVLEADDYLVSNTIKAIKS